MEVTITASNIKFDTGNGPENYNLYYEVNINETDEKSAIDTAISRYKEYIKSMESFVDQGAYETHTKVDLENDLIITTKPLNNHAEYENAYASISGDADSLNNKKKILSASLLHYMSYRRPESSILKVFAIYFMMFVAFIYIRQYAIHPINMNILEFLFIISIILYLSHWTVYFYSKEQYIEKLPIPYIQSLRRLLELTNQNWDSASHAYKSSISRIRRKSEITIEVMAILMAVDIFIMDGVIETFVDAEYMNYTLSGWQIWLLWFALGFSAASFFSFLMTLDSLETIFNSFIPSGRKLITDYFNSIVITPKYFGLFSMKMSIIFYVASINPLVGIIIVTIAVLLTYKFLYPIIPTCIREDDEIYLAPVKVAYTENPKDLPSE